MNEYLSARECATQSTALSNRNKASHQEWMSNTLARKVPYMLGESKVHLGEVDKVFASDWLSEDVVIFGTKCNQVSTVFMAVISSIVNSLADVI